MTEILVIQLDKHKLKINLDKLKENEKADLIENLLQLNNKSLDYIQLDDLLIRKKDIVYTSIENRKTIFK